MEGKKEILIKTAKEYYTSGIEALNKERNNSAVVLFYKALVSLVDLHVLNETGQTPSSHSQRFLILKASFPEIYDILDRDFPHYQSSYDIIMSKELAEVIKEDAEAIAGKTKIKL